MICLQIVCTVCCSFIVWPLNGFNTGQFFRWSFIVIDWPLWYIVHCAWSSVVTDRAFWLILHCHWTSIVIDRPVHSDIWRMYSIETTFVIARNSSSFYFISSDVIWIEPQRKRPYLSSLPISSGFFCLLQFVADPFLGSTPDSLTDASLLSSPPSVSNSCCLYMYHNWNIYEWGVAGWWLSGNMKNWRMWAYT